MFSVIVSDRKSDMENRQAIRPEQRKLFPSDYFSRNFSLMIISLNGRIFTPGEPERAGEAQRADSASIMKVNW